MNWIVWAIIIIACGYGSMSQDCHKHFIEEECKFYVVCSGSQSYLGEFSEFISHNVGTECKNTVYYNGHQCVPIHLKLQAPVTNLIPYEDVDLINNLIYSLDIDPNSIEYELPVFRHMPNLVCLILAHNNLTTAILSNEYQLDSIKEIDLSYNSISVIEINTEQYPYTTLNKINLSNNHMNNIPDGIFDIFDDLESLDLSFNYINSLSASTFDGMRNLLNLDLENNRLTDLNYSLFRFNKLKSLNLKANKIKNIHPTDFDKMHDLVSLDLSFNYIKLIDVSVLKNTVSLKSLNIGHNFLEAIEKDTFINLKSLMEIDLSHNKIRLLNKGLFRNTSISSFSINDNGLQGSLEKGMLEGINVETLNFADQYLTAIEDYAFYNINKLTNLLLNSNKIERLSRMCFGTLENLQMLDLSYNFIENIDFIQTDLRNLRKIVLKSNRLVQITNGNLQYLGKLEYLDLADNLISSLEPNSFQHLSNLLNLALSNNPLNGTLKTGTFEGFVSLPRLDITGSLITTIENGSFSDMNELKQLNISKGKIVEIQYNAFIHTGCIESLDISFNSLNVFFVNLTELGSLNVLMLNNNRIKYVSSTTLYGISSLTKLDLSYNDIQKIDEDAFFYQSNLRDLNLSFNEKLQLSQDFSLIMKYLEIINLSGVKTNLNLDQLGTLSVTEAIISDADINNITKLNVRSFIHVETLKLNNNKVSKLEAGAFSGIHSLMYLDLSFNLIIYIQPGVFKDNSALHSLNISHNALLTVSYGIFRGLLFLHTLDLSYNNITDLQNERFYELQSLSVLIVDHNRITTIDLEEFEGTSLTRLSIGDNPLPCKDLIRFQKRPSSIEITALNKDESNGENLYGVTCSRKIMDKETPLLDNNITNNTAIYSNLLIDIRNILYSINNKAVGTQMSTNETKYIETIGDVIQKSNTKLSNNITSTLMISSNNNKILNNNTNILLEKILNSLQNKPTVFTTQLPPISRGPEPNLPNTYLGDDDTKKLIAHIKKMYNELQIMFNNTIADIKQNMYKIESKLSSNGYQTIVTSPRNEKLVSDDPRKSLFTEICVAIILFILVCIVLYKFYKSRTYIRNRFSISTRELPGAIENSTL